MSTAERSIIGVVKGVKKQPDHSEARSGKSNIITIKSNTSGSVYNVLCRTFCPAHIGDLISGYCTQLNSSLFQFIRPPIVEPGASREEIQKIFTIALKKTGFNKWKSDALYRFFEQQTLEKIDSNELTEEGPLGKVNSTVHRQRSDLSSAVMETISAMSNRFRLDHYIAKPLVAVGLTNDQAEKLLRYWYKSMSLRRLYLLGLCNKEINGSCAQGWTTDTLYYQLLENPYIPIKVPMEKAYSIAVRYGLSIKQDMIDAATIARYIDFETNKMKWSCYPYYILQKKQPKLDKVLPILLSDFKCQIRYNCLYLPHHYKVEDILTDFLTQDYGVCETHYNKNTHNYYNEKELCDEQIKAVELALNNTVSVITGGAGTGKTTVIAALISELSIRDMSYVVAAFTGKAVARLKQGLNYPEYVMTLHGIIYRNSILDDEDDQLDMLIVDEMSMVSNPLFAHALLKLRREFGEFRIVMVGDTNQIEPIEWGNLFNEIVESKAIPHVHLSIDHRRTEKGVLFENTSQFCSSSLATQESDINEVCSDGVVEFKWGNDCHFISGDIPEIESLIKTLNQTFQHHQITIVYPFNAGLEDLNERCQNIFLNPDAPAITDFYGQTWKIGARVMMTKRNFYDIDVMNGEEGTVIDIVPQGPYITVQFGDKKVNIPTIAPPKQNTYEDNDEDDENEPLSTKLLVLSWAITVNKSQGSEWKVVIFYLPEENTWFVNRKVAYTAISRASQELYVVAQTKYAFTSTLNKDPRERKDNLSKRLSGLVYQDHYVDPMNEQMNRLMTS